MEKEEDILGRNRVEDVSWLCCLSESELVSVLITEHIYLENTCFKALIGMPIFMPGFTD